MSANTNSREAPIPLSTKNKKFISSTLISTITTSNKKARKRAKKIVEELKNTIQYCIEETRDLKEIEQYLKVATALDKAHVFIEETCMGLRFPGSWLDFDENGEGKYSAMFGVVVGLDEHKNFLVEVGCKLAVTESPAEPPTNLPFFVDFRQQFLV